MLQQEADVRREGAKERKKNSEFKQRKKRGSGTGDREAISPYRYFELSAAMPPGLIDLLAKAGEFVNLLLPP
jgi:hypothetical protein